MKKSELRQIIKEEINKVLAELSNSPSQQEKEQFLNVIKEKKLSCQQLMNSLGINYENNK